MANPDLAVGALAKPVRAIEKALRRKVEKSEWRRVCQRVDERDKRRCQITGVLLSGGAVDASIALERHHLELRSQNKSRKLNDRNVLTVSRLIHQLLHAGALLLLTKAGDRCLDVRTLDHVAWNRRIVVKGDEPCRLRKGLAVVELEQDRD